MKNKLLNRSTLKKICVSSPFAGKSDGAALHLLEDDLGVGEENAAVHFVFLAGLPSRSSAQVRAFQLFYNNLKTIELKLYLQHIW
jgi:hypothetical protein